MRRAKDRFEDMFIIQTSISFLEEVGRDYISSLSRILYHKEAIYGVRRKISISQSFLLENLRHRLEIIFDGKKSKYSVLDFRVDSKSSVRFHQRIEMLKERLTNFAIKLKQFYGMLMKRVLDLRDVRIAAVDLIETKEYFDKNFK
jgi:hypothetical protein